MGKYKLEIITGRDRDDDGELTKTSFEANNDVDAFVKVLAEFNTCCSGYYNGDYEDDELDEEELETKQKVLAAAESGEDQEECIEILSTLYNDTMDISDYYDDIIKIIAPDGRIVFEDDIDVEAWFSNSDDDYYDEDEDFDESFELKKLNALLESALDEGPDILTFKFDFERKDNTLVCKNEYGYEVEIELEEAEIDDRDAIEQEIEEQMDEEANNIAEDGREITGTEIIGFKYDEETKKGSFEFNIFCEGEKDFDESLNEGKLFYLGWRSNPQLKNGGYYKKFGQLTKAEAKKKENCSYGSMSLTAYETEEDYNKAIEDAKA